MFFSLGEMPQNQSISQTIELIIAGNCKSRLWFGDIGINRLQGNCCIMKRV
jgi:hypothetical protein